MSLLTECHIELGKTLYSFQWIEELLRMCVLYAHLIIHRRVKDVLPFRASDKDLECDSLTQLIEKFKKVNSNQILIDRIEKLRPLRNQCAHRGYLVKFKGECSDIYLRNEILRLEQVAGDADKCVRELFEELKRLGKEIKVNIK